MFWIGGASLLFQKTKTPNHKLKLPTLCLGNLCWDFFPNDMVHFIIFPVVSGRFFFRPAIGECHLGGLEFGFGQVEGVFVSLRFGMKKFIFHSGRTSIGGLEKNMNHFEDVSSTEKVVYI